MVSCPSRRDKYIFEALPASLAADAASTRDDGSRRDARVAVEGDTGRLLRDFELRRDDDRQVERERRHSYARAGVLADLVPEQLENQIRKPFTTFPVSG